MPCEEILDVILVALCGGVIGITVSAFCAFVGDRMARKP